MFLLVMATNDVRFQMNYFQFHIGDYKSATSHLSNEEDLAYRRLLDMYYDTENPIPLETQWVARRIRMDNDVVSLVLKDMFVQTQEGWRHARCDQVIADYREMAEKNRVNGRKGGRKKNPMGSQVVTDSQPNAKLTINQEPKTINQKPTEVAPPDGVSPEVWKEFVQHRKTKKAAVTPLVIKGIEVQAQKAGWTLENALKEVVIRNWQSFNADWVTGKNASSGQSTLPKYR